MLNKDNTRFAELKRIGHEYEERRTAHQAKKQEIIDTYGWESEELKAWYAEKEAMSFPLTGGQSKAYRAWAESIAKGLDEVEMTDYCWDGERADFVNTLREAGIDTFVTSNESTGLLSDLHGYVALGCTMLGLCTITRRESRWGEDEETQVPGIRFSLK